MASSDLAITIPYYRALAKPGGWRRTPADEHGFYVVRLHYHLKRRPERGELYRGSPIADISVPTGVTRVDVSETVEEFEIVDERASAVELLAEHQVVDEFVTELSATLGLKQVLSLSASDRSSLQERWLERISSGTTRRNAVTRSTKTTFSSSITVDGNTAGKTLYLVSSYRLHQYDVYLAFVDYLIVEYQRQGFQIRRRRHTQPPWLPEQREAAGGDWKRAPNVIPSLNWPIRTLGFWIPVTERCPVLESGYTVQVPEPNEVQVSAIRRKRTHPLRTESCDSLYKLSAAAFPPKWTDDLEFAQVGAS